MDRTNPPGWFATCPKGVEPLLSAELEQLGADNTRSTVAGVYFEGPWAVAYRACLWSRLANRVIWLLDEVEAHDGDALYVALRRIVWPTLFDVRRSISVDFRGTNRDIRNTQFGAQRCKDAIVDTFVEAAGSRPQVERANPDVRITVRLKRDRAQVGIDLAGRSLHQRGYRTSGGPAPLKENLAAAILLRADWPAMAARGGALIDPMCGSGTLLIEAALMAADVAPGLMRARFGFEALLAFDEAQWRALKAEANARAERGRAAQLPEIRGYDAAPGAIRRATENIAEIGMQRQVRVSVKSVDELKKPTHRPIEHGLVVSNPPYGERLGTAEELGAVYRQLGERLNAEFQGWEAALFTTERELARATGLRSHKQYTLYNGAMEAQLYLFNLTDNTLRDADTDSVARADQAAVVAPGAQMLANRLRKNARRLKSWLNTEGIEAYRLYDADMPEYAVAVDVYGEFVHVAEYKAPPTVDADAAARRMREVKVAVPLALEVPEHQIVYKERQRQRGTSQYEKRSRRGDFMKVREGRARLLVNLHDYLDTGLFLDHRPLRRRIGAESRGKHFLNLFCYTGTATVHAALGGARATTSVDLSNTYLDWLQRNLELNALSETQNARVKADCLAWLTSGKQTFDLILLDPPSFSNSKSMHESFDVMRDQEALIEATMARLEAGGCLYFSNNRRGFELAGSVQRRFQCEDISASTLDRDFQRSPKIHNCWRIRHGK